MNVSCSACPAKYAVPDEKVAGRKVRITCKRCGTAIVVDGTALGAGGAEASGDAKASNTTSVVASPVVSEAPAPGTAAAAAKTATATAGPASKVVAAAKSLDAIRPRTRSPTIVGGLTASPNSAPGAPGGAGASKTAAAAAAPETKGSTTQSRAAAASALRPGKAASIGARPAPAVVVEKPWTVAVTDDDHRDLKTAEVVELYAAQTIDAETFIWREGMADWLTPFEIPEIEGALKVRGLAPRTNTPDDGSEDDGSEDRHSESGAWREPGRIDGEQARVDPNFDEVTVAMAAPKAQELLEAVSPGLTGKTPDFGSDDGDEPKPAPRPAAGTPAERTEPKRDPERAAVRPNGARVAKRADRPSGDVDLFAKENIAPPEPTRGRMPSVSSEAQEPARQRMPSIASEAAAGAQAPTGARNESSVLFSLDQLTKPQTKGTAPKTTKADAEAWLMDSALSPTAQAAPPSVANLGGGTLFGAGAVMAAPDFTAPVPRSQPSNPPPAAAEAPAEEKKKSSGAMWAIVALVVLGAGGAAAYLTLQKNEPAPEAPSATAAVTAMPATTETATASAAPTEPSAAASAEAPSSAAPAGTSAPTATAAATTTAAAAATATAATAAPGATTAATATAHPTATAALTGAPTPTAAAPKPAPKPSAAPADNAAAEGPEFDRDAAAQALSTANSTAVSQCSTQDGPHGTGKVTVTFVNSGRATNANVSGDFAGSALGGCIARVFRSTHVPAFGGDAVRVTKTVHVP